jgi:hypothetical protein
MNRIKGAAKNAYMRDEITRGLVEGRGRVRSSKFQMQRVQRRLVKREDVELRLRHEYEVI